MISKRKRSDSTAKKVAEIVFLKKKKTQNTGEKNNAGCQHFKSWEKSEWTKHIWKLSHGLKIERNPSYLGFLIYIL